MMEEVNLKCPRCAIRLNRVWKPFPDYECRYCHRKWIITEVIQEENKKTDAILSSSALIH